MFSNIGMQVSLPYLIVYLENFVGVTKTEFSIIGGAVMLGSAIFAIPFGLMADHWNKRTMIGVAIIISSIGGILLSLVKTLLLLALTGLVWQAFFTASGIASVAWLKDLLPEQNRGKFLGVRMIFWVAIPMVIGPWLGSTLIQNFGTPTMTNGETGFIPVPIIFQVGSITALLSLIPLAFTRWKKKHE
jgi:MFS family permease